MPRNDHQTPVSSTPQLLTIEEIADALRQPIGTVRAILARRELPTVKIGRRVMVNAADLADYIQRHTRPAARGPKW